MGDITKIKVDGEPESSYQLYPRNNEFAKRAGGNGSGAGGSGVQPDWNQNDDTQPDYVNNRPFYEDCTEIIPESTVTFVENEGKMTGILSESFDFLEGQKYTISWDGADYVCSGILFSGVPTIGNLGILGTGNDTGQPFLMYYENAWICESIESATEHIIGIKRIDKLVQIGAKYIPFHDSPYKLPIVINKRIQNMSDSEKEQINDAFRSGSLILYAYDPDKIGVCGVITYFYFNKSSSLLKFTYFIKNQICYYDNSIDPLSISSYELSTDSVESIAEFKAKNILQDNPLKYFALNSFTEGSTKKFRITVDDSGALTATELT